MCTCFVYGNLTQMQNLLATEKHCDSEPYFTYFNLVLFCFKTFDSRLIQNYSILQTCSSFPRYLQIWGLQFKNYIRKKCKKIKKNKPNQSKTKQKTTSHVLTGLISKCAHYVVSCRLSRVVQIKINKTEST